MSSKPSTLTIRKARKNKRKRKRKMGGRMGKYQLVRGGFPATKLVRLTYSQEFSLNSGVSTIAQHSFRANSVFDPDYTGVGHQPMRYDTWASVYDHYTVLSSKITLYNMGTGSANNGVPSYYGVFLSNDTTGTGIFTDSTELYENRNCTNPRIAGGAAIWSQNPDYSAKVTKYFSARKFFAVRKPQDGAAYGALITTNPNKEAYFHCYQAPINGTDGGLVNYMARIEYIVLFDEMDGGTQN